MMYSEHIWHKKHHYTCQRIGRIASLINPCSNISSSTETRTLGPGLLNPEFWGQKRWLRILKDFLGSSTCIMQIAWINACGLMHTKCDGSPSGSQGLGTHRSNNKPLNWKYIITCKLCITEYKMCRCYKFTTFDIISGFWQVMFWRDDL